MLYKCIIANASAIQAASCTDYLSSPSCSTRATHTDQKRKKKKSPTLNERGLKILWEKRKKRKNLCDKTERTRGLGRKTRGDRKGESNDSPEIPDRGWGTSDIPGLLSG